MVFFQGNINPFFHCIVHFSGVRVRRQMNGEDEEINRRRRIPCQSISSESSSNDSNSLTDQDANDGRGLPLLNDELKQDEVVNSLAMSGSRCANRDEMGDGDDEDDGTDKDVYSVNVSDFETGQVYQVDGVRVTRSADGGDLSIDTDGEADKKLSFVTLEYFGGGRKADRLLAGLLGAQFVGQKLPVYRGKIVFRYRDQLCVPIPSPQEAVEERGSHLGDAPLRTNSI